MSIFMLGIDHNMAPVDVRAQFAFTRKNTGEALHRLKEESGIFGCIILSTCNRLELWVSTADEEKPGPVSVALLVERCAGRTIPEVFYQQRKRRGGGAPFLSYQRTEIPDPGGRSDPDPGKRCVEYVKG